MRENLLISQLSPREESASHHLISRIRFSQDSQDFVRIVADLTHQLSDSEPGKDTVGIYVENYKVGIENASFGYDLTIGILAKRCLYHCHWRTM